jgi:hypothetical protein
LPIALLLASCGGGGGSPGCDCTQFPAPPPQPAPPPTPAPQNPPTVPLTLAQSTAVTGLDSPAILTAPARDGRQFTSRSSGDSRAR